jgi:fimbrial isopeptide formation D2 family protein/uncharacterized repeat protein (TIGR01451 family)
MLMKKNSRTSSSKKRNLLLSKLEDRILFDATFDAGADPDAGDVNAMSDANESLESFEQDVANYEDEADQAPSSIAQIRNELVIVDTSVDHYQELVDDLLNNSEEGRNIDVVLLDGDSNGVEQVSSILATYGELDAIHLVTHGDDAAFRLGNTWVSADNLDAYAGQIAGWGDALTGDGDILLYGCDLAESAEGRMLVDSIAALTNSDVAASDDDTGSAIRGGDWNLEYRHGTLESTVVFSQQLQSSFRGLLAVGPNVQFQNASQDVQIGEEFQFTVTFDNTGTDTGYGPFVDLVFPVNGADGDAGSDTADGIDFTSATYLGQALNTIEITFPDDGSGTGTIDHPFALDSAGNPLQVTGTAGDKLVVVELPFGSYTQGQPPADIVINATISDLADLETDLTISSRSGFRFGGDPLDNPTSDPSVVSDPATDSASWTEQMTVTPTLIELSKTYLGPENETATGPNHVQQYRIDVDIADGQTISNLDIIDSLPPNVVVTSIDSVLVNGAAAAYSDNLGSLSFPGNNLDLIVTPTNDVTGTSSGSDVSITFSFYVTEFDADGDRVIPIDGEDDTVSTPDSRSFNNARAVGDWDPNDTRDAGGTDNAVADPDSTGPEHTLDDKAIAIQKSVAIVNNVGVSGANPGDTLEYTLNFQISDFYTFGDLVIDDIFQDGQLFDFTYGATFSVTDLNGNVSGNFTVRSITDADGGQTLVVDETDIDRSDDTGEIGSGPSDGSDGTTTLRFDLSQAMIDNGAADGILQGGLSNGATNGGAASGTITFRTIIQEDYADTFASGDRSVDQGDTITNSNLSITGTVRENAEDGSISNVVNTETDSSSASIVIATGTLIKDVYAINGNTTLPTGPSGKTSLTAGDVVTYRIQYTVPTSDFESLRLTDFLPLPIFDATDHNADGVVDAADDWTFNLAGSFDGSAPASGQIEFGANDTFYASNAPDSNIIPTISVGSSNELQLTFGSYDDPSSQSSVIEIYFSITAQNDPTADGLFLTNIVRAEEGTTQNTPTVLDQIVQVEVLQPELNITKGIVSSDSATAAFDSAIGPAGITFGTAGTGGALFTGGFINSNALSSQRINANITGGIDAGDTIRYAVVLENTGNSTRGAYDVTISDSLPAGFSLVAGSVRIVDGTGASVSYSGAEADLFTTGIELDDPGATPGAGDGTNEGAIDGYDATDGQNVVIVFYDVTADASVEADQTYVNTAVIENFAGQEDGANHAANRPSDDASARIENVSVTKSIVSTSEAHTSAVDGVERVTIGEIVRYRVEVALPEGSLTDLQIHDVLPTGLTFIDDGTATVSFISDGVGITSSTVTSGVLPDDAVSRNSGSENDNYDTGRDVYFKLGDIDNNDRDTNIEYAVIEFNVLVDNNNASAGSRNDTGESRFNDVRVRTNGAQIYDMPNGNRPRIIIAEPLVQNIDKSGSITTGDAGDSITYTVTFDVASGNNQSDAFNVRLFDTLPSDMTLGSITSVTIDGVAASFTDSTSGNTIDILLDRVNTGQAVEVVYTATIDLTVSPEDVLANTAQVTWSSLPGASGTANGSGGNTTGSDLATLNGLNNGDMTYDTATGSLHGQRDGSDGSGNNPNDYATSDSHSVTIDGVTTFTKTLVSTEIDDAFNGLNDAVIGELVTYRLQVTFPEGTTPNAVILDTLDNGLAFVGQTNSSLDDVSITGSLTPTIGSNGRTVTWDFGTVTDANLANDTDGSITIEYQAVVLNVAGNQAGTRLDNSARFRWNNDSGTDLVRDADDVIVREPQVDVSKSVEVNAPSGSTSGDAGDPVEYTIVIENTGNYDAFDVTFSDTLPTVSGGTSAILGATFGVVDSMAGGLTVADFTLSGSDATGYTLSLNAGVDLDLLKSQGARTITLTVNGTIASTNGPNDIVSNTANAQWTSLDGDVTSRAAITTDDDGERDGTNPSDNTHDYSDGGTATFSINPPTFTKSLFATDQTETSGTDVTIGERVTYALLVSLPEGTTAGMSVVDLLPAGLNYESFQVVTTAAGSGGLLSADFNGTLTGGAPAVSGGAADGDDVTFTFGQIDVAVDNVTTNNSFVVLVTAAVSDVASNVGYNPSQTTLTNTATIDIVGDSITTPQASNSVDVDVIESNLEITKNIIQPLADAGDTLTIELLIENTGLGDAYEVRLEDTINSAHYDLSTVSIGVSGAAYPADFTANYNSASGLLSYAGGTIAAGDAVTFTITLDLLDTVAVDSTLVNTATITNASTLQGSVPGERDNPDPDNDGSDTDNDSVRIRSNSLAGNVYFDADNDGVFDGAESGIAGVDVRLRGVDHLGNTVDTTVQTLADGSYLFDDLRPGTYRITETQPTTAINGKDYLDGSDTIGTQGGNSSANDDFTNIVLPTGAETNGTNNNFGELEEAELSGFVWHDANNDGIKDVTEVGIGGVEVTLLGSDDQGAITPVTVTTNLDGSYTFDGLRPGEYTISQAPPTNPAPSGRDYVDGRDADGSLANGDRSVNDVTSSINAAAGDTGTDYNFGEVVESVISGYVYHDSNNDGSRVGDTGIELVTITLTGVDDLGNVVNRSTQTDGAGFYQFANLRPAGAGGYTLTQSQPAGYLDGIDTIGTPGGNASVNDVFSSINVTSDTDGTENNFGELLAASIRGTVFSDHNNDGTQQVGEQGIGGVQVRLTGQDDLGNSVDVAVLTNPDGTYSIAGLRPSDASGYTLTETQPGNYNDGIDSDGSLANGDVTANDVNSGINLVSNDDGTGYDFAERGTSISGTVYVDDDRDGGLDPGENDRVSGVLIELYDSTGTTLIDSMLTSGTGDYRFGNLPAGDYVIRQIHPAEYSSTTPDTLNVTLPLTGLTNQDFGENLWGLGDFVWFDTNGDGVQDSGEPGLEGIGVTLTYAGIDGDFSTAADNLVYNTTTDANGVYEFEDLFNGQYRVTIASTDLPGGVSGTAEVDDSTAAIDGTSNVAIGGGDRFDVDFGYTGTGSVGDTVFWDQNGNTTQDANEIGLQGVVVELDVDLDGDGSAELTLSTTTDSNGNYLFERVPAGNHVVRVVQPSGTVQTFDSDGVGSGNQSTVNLIPGENDEDQDFGYRGTGSIGDTVFFDMTGDGGAFGATGDYGIPGVRVTLEIDVDGDGTVDLTRTQTTDADGEYLFENLIAGDYRISLEPTDLPAALGNFATVDRDGTLNHETDVTLADGQTVVDADFGYYATPEYEIIKTDDLAGAPASPGTTFSYFLFVINNGDMDGTGVVVTDNLPINVLDGFSVITDDPANVAYDPTTGQLIWNAGDLSGLGGNRTLQVTVTVQDPVSVLLTTFDNTATVTDDGNHGPDPVLSNNTSTDPVSLVAVPDYEIEKTSSLTETAMVGDSFFYTIRVSNIGDQDGTGVVVTDQIPVSVLDRFNVTTDDPSNVSYDPSTGELVWDVGDLDGRGDTRTLTVFVDIPFVVEDPLANVITNTAMVTDDGTNGPEERLDNNSSTVEDGVLVFAFDSFNNFAVTISQTQDPIYGWEYGDSARHHKPLPVDPIFSGLAEPGTTLSLKIYDKAGNLIGERQVVADSGGNWLANFPNTVIWKHPYRMDVEQTAPIQTDVHELDGFNMRRYFHPAFHSSLFFVERDTVSSVMRNSAYETIDSMHAANNNPLQVGWRSHLYQLNVSSTNAAAD